MRLDARSGTQDPYWTRLLHRCTVRPMTIRISLLMSHGPPWGWIVERREGIFRYMAHAVGGRKGIFRYMARAVGRRKGIFRYLTRVVGRRKGIFRYMTRALAVGREYSVTWPARWPSEANIPLHGPR
eukprot:1286069-Pyramimonas_sp.AAC.1